MTDSNMSDATSQGSSMTSGLAEAGRGALEQATSAARDAMPRITEAARTQATAQAETAKDALADTGERLAQSLRSALDGGDDSVQARLMAAAADAVTDLSNQLRGRSFNDLLNDASAFARRNPGAFVAAAALAGFAIARFARASATSNQGSQYSDQYGSQSYGGGYGSSSGMGGMASSSMGTGDMGGSSMGSGSGSGMGSGGGYAGGGSFGVGTGAGYGSGHQVSTSGMSTHDDDLDEAGSIADDGMGGGTQAGTSGTATPNSSSDSTGSGYDR